MSSSHSIEYHRNWAKFFAFALIPIAALLTLAGITTHASHLAEVKAYHDEMVACIQSDRPAADCRLIVYGSK